MYLCFSSLSHPNIVSLYGFVQNEDEVVIVTNFVEGRSLHAMLFGKNKTTVRISFWVHVYVYYSFLVAGCG